MDALTACYEKAQKAADDFCVVLARPGGTRAQEKENKATYFRLVGVADRAADRCEQEAERLEEEVL
jgi:hypothetical protein